uniref:Secreted protein n=1 Tax=Ascaris lumbricoides TaxID=6252 RepID=A0A0M3HYF6_ASCLU
MLFLFSSIPHPHRCLFICIACPKWIQPSRSWTFLVFEFRVKQWHYRKFSIDETKRISKMNFRNH